MEPIDRRSFFKQTGAAAVVVSMAGAVASVPLGVGSAVAGAATVRDDELTLSEQLHEGEHLVAHVKNARTGEISLFVGEREVRIHDRQIAARLVRLIR